MLVHTTAPEFVGEILRTLSKYSNQWEVLSVGTTCSNQDIDGKTNPYVITLRNTITGEEIREYIPYYRLVRDGGGVNLMNAERRKALADISSRLIDIREDIEAIKEEEQYVEDIPENTKAAKSMTKRQQLLMLLILRYLA